MHFKSIKLKVIIRTDTLRGFLGIYSKLFTSSMNAAKHEKVFILCVIIQVTFDLKESVMTS